MTALTNRDILIALDRITDPDSGKSVVASGMLQGLVVKDGHVGFALEIDPSQAEPMESLRQVCEKAAYDVKGVISVTAVLTAHSEAPSEPAPAQPSPRAKQGPQGQEPQQLPAGLKDVKQIIAVASGKGGVGKSTVAVNLAAALSASGLAVGLLDADIYGPSIPRMLGLAGQKPVSDGKTLQPMENYGLKCMSIGFLVEEDTPMIWRGPMVMSALTQMMADVSWGALDVLVVDMPPGTGDAQLTMAQTVPLAGAVIVSTPQEIALIDARKGIAMFEKTNVPILGLIENMSYFISPDSSEKSYIFGQGGVRRTAETLGMEFLGEIPLHMDIRQLSDEGTPIVATRADHPQVEIFMAIAKRLSEKLDAGPAKAAPKIVIE